MAKKVRLEIKDYGPVDGYVTLNGEDVASKIKEGNLLGKVIVNIKPINDDEEMEVRVKDIVDIEDLPESEPNNNEFYDEEDDCCCDCCDDEYDDEYEEESVLPFNPYDDEYEEEPELPFNPKEAHPDIYSRLAAIWNTPMGRATVIDGLRSTLSNYVNNPYFKNSLGLPAQRVLRELNEKEDTLTTVDKFLEFLKQNGMGIGGFGMGIGGFGMFL